jgi:cytoskeletal protein CcmA (bactofilin family)
LGEFVNTDGERDDTYRDLFPQIHSNHLGDWGVVWMRLDEVRRIRLSVFSKATMELVPSGFKCTYSLDECQNANATLAVNQTTVLQGNLELQNNTIQVTSNLTVKGDLNVNSTYIHLEGVIQVQADLQLSGNSSRIEVSNAALDVSGNLVGNGVIVVDPNAQIKIGGCLDGKDSSVFFALSQDELRLLNQTGRVTKEILSFSCLKSQFHALTLENQISVPNGSCISYTADYAQSRVSMTILYQSCEEGRPADRVSDWMTRNGGWFWTVIFLILIAILVGAGVLVCLKNKRARRALSKMKLKSMKANTSHVSHNSSTKSTASIQEIL